MDMIFNGWAEHQQVQGMKLAAASDVLTLIPAPGTPPRQYFARYACPVMAREQDAITQRSGFAVMINFPRDYLRAVSNAAQVVAIVTPQTLWHPNVAGPFICIGAIAPGTSLVELLHQIYEILSFQKFTSLESNALNVEACAWTRRNTHMFPLTTRPLRRRVADLKIAEITPGATP